MKKISVLSITIVFISFLSACGQLPANESNEAVNQPKGTQNEAKNYCNDFPENAQLMNEPFKVDKSKGEGFEEGYGSVTVSGTFVKKPIEYKGVDIGNFDEKVYLKIENAVNGDSEKAFYDYFRDMIKSGNTVNLGTLLKPELGFTVGAMDGGNFSSTAEMSNETKQEISDNIGTENIKTVKLYIPKYIGRGAPENFSFACKIEISANQEAKNNPVSIEYTNEDYGFSLMLPASWKGYSVTPRTLDWGTVGESDSFDFGFQENSSLFNISAHKKEQWEKLKSVDGPTPMQLSENNNYVFAYSPAQDAGSDVMISRLGEVAEIIKTFTVTK